MKSDTLVYACSGCSNVAQMTNYVALELTKLELAEMSCIAGVGGGVPALVKKAKSANYILALDGCAFHCTKNCLKQQGLTPDKHLTLSDLGLRKKHHEEFDRETAQQLIDYLAEELATLEQA